MLALLAWRGVCQASSSKFDDKIKLHAFSSLGGNYVGSLRLSKPTTSNIVETIKDLQRQAALLLRHGRRTPNYMILVVDNIRLPTLKYSNDMKGVNEQVLACLQHTTNASKVELMWDEDDSQALDVLKARFKMVLRTPGIVHLSFKSSSIVPELEVLTFLPNIHKVFIQDDRTDCDRHGSRHALDLGFLTGMLDLRKLDFSFVTITSWNFAKNLKLTAMALWTCTITTPSVENLPYLVTLSLLFGTKFTKLTPSTFSTCTSLNKLFLTGYKDEEIDTFRDCKVSVS